VLNAVSFEIKLAIGQIVLALLLYAADGIRNIYRAKRYPGQLTCYLHHAIPLLNTIEDGTGISIRFQDKPVESRRELVLVKVAVVNDGREDIREDMVDDPLRLGLPEGCRWLAGSVVPGKSKGKDQVHPKIDYLSDPRAAAINATLVKIDECINVNLVAEVDQTSELQPSSSRVNNELYVTHRIEKTSEARLIRLENRATAVLRLQMWAMALAAMLMPLAVMFVRQFPSARDAGVSLWGLAIIFLGEFWFLIPFFLFIVYKVVVHWRRHRRFKRLQQLTGNFGEPIPQEINWWRKMWRKTDSRSASGTK
jgi:hypothetical protein